MVDKIKLSEKNCIKQDDAVALHRALLVLKSITQARISYSLHVYPPAKQTMESESGEKPFGKAALRERMMKFH